MLTYQQLSEAPTAVKQKALQDTLKKRKDQINGIEAALGGMIAMSKSGLEPSALIQSLSYQLDTDARLEFERRVEEAMRAAQPPADDPPTEVIPRPVSVATDAQMAALLTGGDA